MSITTTDQTSDNYRLLIAPATGQDGQPTPTFLASAGDDESPVGKYTLLVCIPNGDTADEQASIHTGYPSIEEQRQILEQAERDHAEA